MIKTENLIINNRSFIKTFSDCGYMVEREGVQYSEAIDPAEFNRTYTETNISIEGLEATEEDYLNSLARLGVE